jgi:hypothetical protein
MAASGSGVYSSEIYPTTNRPTVQPTANVNGPWIQSTGGINTYGYWNTQNWNMLHSSDDGRYVYMSTYGQGSYLSRDGGNSFPTQTITCWGCYSYGSAMSRDGQTLVFLQANYDTSSTVSYDNGYTWSGFPTSADSLAWNAVTVNGDGSRIFGVVTNSAIYYPVPGSSPLTYAISSIFQLHDRYTRPGSLIACSSTGQYVIVSVSSVQSDLPNYILVSDNYGQNFYPTGNNVFIAENYRNLLISSDGQYMLVFHPFPYIWFSSNYGQNWSWRPNLSVSFVSVKGSSDLMKLVGITGIANSPLYYSDDRGVSWYTNNNAPLAKWDQISMDANRQYLVGSGYGLPIQHNPNIF